MVVSIDGCSLQIVEATEPPWKLCLGTYLTPLVHEYDNAKNIKKLLDEGGLRFKQAIQTIGAVGLEKRETVQLVC